MNKYSLAGALFVLLVLAGGLYLYTKSKGAAGISLSIESSSTPMATSSSSTSIQAKTAPIMPAVFNEYKVAVGDKVGNFIVTDGAAAAQPDPSYPYPTYVLTFKGNLTVIGTVDIGSDITGPTIDDIASSTAIGIPHTYDSGVPSGSITIDNPDVSGAQNVHYGDTVEAAIDSIKIISAPKNSSGLYAHLTSIKVLSKKPLEYIPSPVSLPDISVTLPTDWSVTNRSDTGITLLSPDYETASLWQDIPSVLKGHRVTILVQQNHLSPSISDPTSFVAFEEDVFKDVSNKVSMQETTINGTPAFEETTKYGTDIFTGVSTAHGSDEIDISFTPGIRDASDSTFIDQFLKGVTIK